MPTITICGSMLHLDKMKDVATVLKILGFNVFLPEGTKKAENYTQKIEHDYIKKHYNLIKRSSAILVINEFKHNIAGYIGANTLMEIGFAYTLNKDIFLLNPPSKKNFGYDEILATQPIILNNNLNNIVDHFDKLPITFVASTNQLKIDAVDTAFRKMGIKVQAKGLKVETGISAQPLSLDETYTGAKNRLENLERAITSFDTARDYKYLVAIESGNQEYKGTFFGHSVVLIKEHNKQEKVGIAWDPPMPQEFLDLVPDTYSDFGVLVQEKYGIKEKDPYTYLTNGKLSRFDFLVDAVIRAIAG